MAKRNTTNLSAPEFHRIDNLDLATYFLLHKIDPVDRETEGSTAFLFFPRSPEVDKLIIDFMTPCSECGITFSAVGPARARARRMLIEGELDGRQ